MRRARRYLIGGRVQGVGFRFFTEAAAVRENLHGWARNLADGGVEVTAEGEVEALDRFENAIRQGPRAARVERFEVNEIAPNGRDTGFIIK